LLSLQRTRILGTIIHLKTFTLGSLLTFGFFTRFTFLFFFFPIGFELVRHQDALLLEQYTKKQDKVDPAAFGGPSIFKRLVTCIQILLQGFLAFLIWSSIMIFVDTWYFQDTNGFVISPWNNLLYNLKHENVAQHGIHPRITHTFVNMPMLFGLTFLVTMWRFVHSIWYQKTMSSSTQWLYACVLIPLCLISVSPHQEPRFLLPLTVPLHLLLARKRMSKSLQVLSTTINLLMLFFFGFFHQAGIVPMLLSIQEPSPSFHRPWLGDPCQFNRSVASASFFASSTLVFYKTYMPPRFLLAGLNGAVHLLMFLFSLIVFI
jgi:phosphatidylinositol glycan class Z